jgi:hypothetical protein
VLPAACATLFDPAFVFTRVAVAGPGRRQPAGVHNAAEPGASQLPKALTDDLAGVAPQLDRVPGWWWAVGGWQ